MPCGTAKGTGARRCPNSLHAPPPPQRSDWHRARALAPLPEAAHALEPPAIDRLTAVRIDLRSVPSGLPRWRVSTDVGSSIARGARAFFAHLRAATPPPSQRSRRPDVRNSPRPGSAASPSLPTAAGPPDPGGSGRCWLVGLRPAPRAAGRVPLGRAAVLAATSVSVYPGTSTISDPGRFTPDP